MKHKLSAFLVLALAVPALAADHYRWAVKTGADPSAAAVRATAKVSVDDLCAVARPFRPTPEGRISPVERTIYTVVGKLLMFRREEDGDIHLVIQDERSNETLLAEIPDPATVPPGSPWYERIATARTAFLRQFRPSSSRTDGERLQITVVGVGFWDRRHGAEGAADNGIELHPVLAYSTP